VDGIPHLYSLTQFRKDNPDTSFPSEIGEDMLKEFGVYPLQVQPKPPLENPLQKTVDLGITFDEVKGMWTTSWSIVDLSPEEIRAKHDRMRCSPLQGKLALGEVEWAKVEAYRDNYATWAEKTVIDSAQEWRRNSQDIQFFGYLLGYTDEQMDKLFEVATQIVV